MIVRHHVHRYWVDAMNMLSSDGDNLTEFDKFVLRLLVVQKLFSTISMLYPECQRELA